MIKACLYAVQLFARAKAVAEPALVQRQAVLCSPLLGVALGAVLWAIHVMLVGVLDPALEAVILLAVWMALPAFGPVAGVSHLVTQWAVQQQLRPEVRQAASGIAAGLILLAHWLLLVQLLTEQVIWLLFLAPVAGRIAALALISVLPARSGESEVAEHPLVSSTHPAVVLWVGWLLFGLGIGFGLTPLVVLLLVAFAVFWLAKQQAEEVFLQAGAMVAVMEVAILLVLLSVTP